MPPEPPPPPPPPPVIEWPEELPVWADELADLIVADFEQVLNGETLYGVIYACRNYAGTPHVALVNVNSNFYYYNRTTKQLESRASSISISNTLVNDFMHKTGTSLLKINPVSHAEFTRDDIHVRAVEV